MLFDIATKHQRASQEAECVICRGERWSYGKVHTWAKALSAFLQDRGVTRVAFYIANSPKLIALLLAADRIGLEAVLLHREFPLDEVHRYLFDLDIETCLTDANVDEGPRLVAVPEYETLVSNPLWPETFEYAQSSSKVLLLTTGTTGRPKTVVHSWASLAGPIRREESYRDSRWLLAYDLTRFAGIQVFLQAFVNGGVICIPAGRTVGEVIDTMLRERISHVSATPTFWWRLLFESSRKLRQALPLVQLTLGGEAAPQTLLDALRSNFPQARITHTYASTEAGFCFASSDGIEGYSLEVLENNLRRVRIRIVNGELWISSPYAMQGYFGSSLHQEEWTATGDLVEVKKGRLIILGRAGDCINVGGNKVFPTQVEGEIRRVAGVRDVRAYGQRSSLVGQVVKAEVVPENGVDTAKLKEEILHYCRQRLQPYQVPRIIEFVEHIPISDGGKVVRRD